MVDRESNFANAFQTVLDAPMGATDLTATVAGTAGAPTSPCYLVIDPENDATREYVYFDGVFTGTTFVTSDIANRYLSGSAAASGITHAVGAVVKVTPAAQMFEDLHDRIGVVRDSPTYRGARAYPTANQSIPTGTVTVINLDGENHDTHGMHDTVTNNSRILLNQVGRWMVLGTITYEAHATGRRLARVHLNGIVNTFTAHQATASGSPCIQVSAVIDATAVTDYVELAAFQDSGVARNAAGGNDSTSLIAYYLGT